MTTKPKTVRAAVYAPDGTELTYDRPPNKWDVAGIAQNSAGSWHELAHGNSTDSVRKRALTKAYRWKYVTGSVTAVRIWEATAPCVREYFGHHKVNIARVFYPGRRGWEDVKLHGGWSNIRKQSLKGVTAVEFRLASSADYPGIVGARGVGDAQFQMAELLASMRLPKQKICRTMGHDHLPATQRVTWAYAGDEPKTEFVCQACLDILLDGENSGIVGSINAIPLAR